MADEKGKRQARGMGRGLAAILPTSGESAEPALRELALELVIPNRRQPRQEFDDTALKQLADSIADRGVLQPIVVRPLAGGRFELVAGERRLRAAKLAELERIPAIVRETGDWERLELALMENMAREDLSPVEQARACATLVDDLGLTKEAVGRRVGRSRVAISNLIRLLDLPDEALALIESNELSEGHGRALLMCKDHARRRRLAKAARDGGWSVRETERRARAAEGGGENGGRRQVVIHPDLEQALAAVEDALTAALNLDVEVRPRKDGCRVVLDFDRPDEALELARRLGTSLPRAA